MAGSDAADLGIYGNQGSSRISGIQGLEFIGVIKRDIPSEGFDSRRELAVEPVYNSQDGSDFTTSAPHIPPAILRPPFLEDPQVDACTIIL